MKTNNAILILSTIIMLCVMCNNIYKVRAKYMPFVVENKISALRTSNDVDNMISQESFLIDEGDLSTGEVFAIDEAGNVTTNISNIPQGGYLPYSPLFDDEEGFAYYDGRFIAWQKYQEYTIIYRKYVSEVVADESTRFFAMILFMFLIIWSNNYTHRNQSNHLQSDAFDFNAVLRDTLKNVPEGCLLVHSERNIRYVNKAFTRITGWHNIDLKNKVIEDILPSEMRSKHEAHFDSYKNNTGGRATHQNTYRTVTIPNKRGQRITMDLSFAKFVHKPTGEDYYIATMR